MRLMRTVCSGGGLTIKRRQMAQGRNEEIMPVSKRRILIALTEYLPAEKNIDFSKMNTEQYEALFERKRRMCGRKTAHPSFAEL